MSCNNYTIELIVTQLVTLENNTTNHSPWSKKYSAVRTVLRLLKMSKSPSTPVVQLCVIMSKNYNKNTIMILIMSQVNPYQCLMSYLKFSNCYNQLFNQSLYKYVKCQMSILSIDSNHQSQF
jgi:hypothetical protein